MQIQIINQKEKVEAITLAASNKKPILKVLFVDDDQSLIEISKLMLMEIESCIKIDCASCVDEAFQKLNTEKYDAIVSDYEMPQKDGLQFLKELNRQKKDIPFILFTGKGREEIVIKALNLGADGYINKHGNPETVYGELVHSIMKNVAINKALTDFKVSEERFSAYVKESPAAFFVVDSEGKYQEVNESACNLLGYSRKELLEFTVVNLLFQEDITFGLKQFNLLKKTGKNRFEIALKKKDGQPIDVIMNATKLSDGSLMAFCEDITERKKAEETLAKSEKKHRSLFSAMTEGFCYHELIYDASGKAINYIILDANPAYEAIIGLRKEQVIGRKATEAYGTAEPPYIEIYAKVAQTQEPVMFETYFPPMNKYFRISVFSPNKNHFATVFNDITENKKAQEILKSNENQLSNAQRIAHLGSWDWNLETNEEVWSDEQFRIFGFEPQSFKPTHDTFLKALHPKDYQKVLNAVERALKGTQHYAVECRILSHKGDIRHIFCQGEVFRASKGTPARMIGTVLDISKRKKAEDSLKINEEKFRQLFSTLPNAIAVYEAVEDGNDFVFIEFNAAAEKIEKMKKESIIGKRVTEAFPGVKKFGLFEIFQRVWRSGKAEYYPEALYRDDRDPGTWRENWVYRLSDRKIVAIYNDITRRKKIEEQLKTNSEIFDLATEAIYVLDLEGNIVNFNQAACKQSGYNEDELHKMNIRGLDTSESAKLVEKRLRTIVEEGSAVFESVQVRKDKVLFPVEIHARAINIGGKTLVLSLTRDISESKKAEEKLNRIMDQLIQINEKMSVVGSLTRHDVSNKLMTIRTNMYLLRKKLGNKLEYEKYLNTVDLALKGANEIFEFSRMYERIGSEKLSIENICICFNQALALFPSLGFTRVNNKCGGLEVLADSLLKQLFYNFIDNSLKHGKKVTQISLHYRKGADQLKLFYEDDGVGVPKSNKSKLFEAGFTTSKSSGLGLYLVKKMLDVYGWTITEEGELGKGAKFVITIPKLNKNGEENYQFKS